MVARLRAFWVLARQEPRLACRDSCARGPRGPETGVWVLGLHVVLAVPTGGLSRRVPAAGARSGAGNAEIVAQEEEGTQVAASGPGTLRGKVVRRGTGDWAGGLATWRGKSPDGVGQGSTERQGGSWEPNMRVKVEMGVVGREKRVLETREP